MEEYEIDRSITPPSCLPAGIDKRYFLDVTKIGDKWRVYIDPKTNKVHDGAYYFALMKKAIFTATSAIGKTEKK